MPTITFLSRIAGLVSKEINDFSEFIILLNEIFEECESPRIVVLIEAGNSGTMYFGIHEKMAFLSHNPSDFLPPYMVTQNQDFVSKYPGNDDVVELDFLGEITEFCVKTFIPMSMAIDVLKEFWEKGTLSDRIDWVEV